MAEFDLVIRNGQVATAAVMHCDIGVKDGRIIALAVAFAAALDDTPYESKTVQGYPKITLSRGEVVYRQGDLIAERGRGQFLPCATSLARPKVTI